jgi:hypothetical protein
MSEDIGIGNGAKLPAYLQPVRIEKIQIQGNEVDVIPKRGCQSRFPRGGLGYYETLAHQDRHQQPRMSTSSSTTTARRAG